MTNNNSVFTHLVLGLASLTEEPARWKTTYPPGLIRAMNGIALQMGEKFPKTLTAFLKRCEAPLAAWYPEMPDDFSDQVALLQGGKLTEPASDYLYNLSDEILEHQQRNGFVPASVLDNWEFVKFMNDLRGMEDKEQAQRNYVAVRSFLIEHSFMTRTELRELNRLDLSEPVKTWIKNTFYQIDDSSTDFYYCDRCGILQRADNGKWVGLKPVWCDDHALSSEHVHAVSNTNYTRLKPGIHLRTFIPGRTELALFSFADALMNEYEGHVVGVERYPGLDMYDLRLVFRDEAWAVDVKDIADPESLARTIVPLLNGGNLQHNHAFYVVPDRRLELLPDYLEQVRRHGRKIKPPLYLVSENDFKARATEKARSLVKASR